MDSEFESGFEECWTPIRREACGCLKGRRCAGCLEDADLTLPKRVRDQEAIASDEGEE